jgi:hypothetical protein
MTQRDKMRQLYDRFRNYPNCKERCVKAYVQADERGEVHRASNQHGIRIEIYASGLYNEGVRRKGWIKTILLMALCLAALPTFAQTPDSSPDSTEKPAVTQPAKVTANILESKLDSDEGAFHVTLNLVLNGKPLIKALNPDDDAPDYGYEDIVIDLNADGKTITYLAKKRKGLEVLKPLTIDLSNKQEIEALSTLIMAYKSHVMGRPTGGFERDEGGIEVKPLDNVHSQAFTSAYQAYHGIFGECIGATEDYGSLKGLPDLKFRSSDDGNKEFGLPEPITLLYIIKNQTEFWQMREQAVTKNRALELAAKQQAEAEAQQKAEELRQAQEQQARIEQTNKVALVYLSSPDGQNLANQIQNQYKNFVAKRNKEKAYITAFQDEITGLEKALADPANSHSDIVSINQQIRQAVSDESLVDSQYKESPELKQMREKLNALLDQFQNKAGLSYDDTIKISKSPAAQ